MKYVIACLFKGEVLEFHEKLLQQVCVKFKVKRQKLPAHFTIKAPFEADDITELQKVTEKFCMENVRSGIDLKGFDHFRDNVIFIDIKPSKEAVDVHDKYIDELKKIKWLTWRKNDGKGKKFHCTIVSKRIKDKFVDIWNYVNNFNAEFSAYFDNISILVWNNNMQWEIYKEYKLKLE